MTILKRIWIGLKRFRYRKGYGVHSPFAFDFITGVIYEHGMYYAYDQLKTEHPWKQCAGMLHKHEQKCARLLFRLVNYVHPDVVVVQGDLPSWQRNYIKAASRNAFHQFWPFECQCVQAKKTEQELKIDWFYGSIKAMSIQELDKLLVRTHSCSMMVLKDIRSEKKSWNTWTALQKDSRVGVTFDLYDYGIVFFDTDKHKQHYIVNF